MRITKNNEHGQDSIVMKKKCNEPELAENKYKKNTPTLEQALQVLTSSWCSIDAVLSSLSIKTQSLVVLQ